MSQVLCAAPLVCLQVDSGRRNISYLTPDEELLERLRKDHGENAIVSVRYFIHNEADGTERAQPWNKNKSRAEAMLRRQYHGAGSRCFHG